ncbi:phenylethanolamine N-methyltransferase-like [Brachionichthys hirsutus]|uniref:phenylethanolamine N-methyltransferase-like n=1 Tax=Brachionichthys hirsutus TaxID=412623 RepID=UPI003604E280
MEGAATENSVAAMAACYERFDPETFLQKFCSAEEIHLDREDGITRWELARLHGAFTEGDMRGERLLDVGSGPTLYQVMSACEVFNQVILTDFLEANRRELRLWLQNEGGSKMNWTPFLQHVCKLEGRRPSEWTDKATKLRQVVTDVLPIDVHRPHPLGPDAPGSLPFALADCVTSCFCLEGASPDLGAFNRALIHIVSLLRPGGHLLLMGNLGETYYLAGPGAKIPVVALSEAKICSALKESGCSLIRLEVFQRPSYDSKEHSDSEAKFFLKARKN